MPPPCEYGNSRTDTADEGESVELTVLCCLLLRKQVKDLVAGLTKEKGNAAIESTYNTYASHWGQAPEQSVVKKTVADMETDFLFLVPTQTALQLHTRNSR